MLHAYTSASSSSTLHLASAISSSTTLSSPYSSTAYDKHRKGLGSRSEVSLTTFQPVPVQVVATTMGLKTGARTTAAQDENMSKLHELFAQGLAVKDVEGVLEEFAWRSLLRGVCVREWCSELKYILDQFPPNRTVLSTFELPHICLMYPFLTSSPLSSAYNNAYPSPLVPVAYLQCLTRDMTVDALLNVGTSDENAPARVMELCIEYIGHTWRTAWSNGNHGGVLADMLSKELAELDQETFLLVRDPYLKAFLKPLIQRIRFNIGLVSSTQLVSYFPATNRPRSPSSQTLTDAYYISTAFARRRLNAGVPVQAVVDDLYFIRDRLPTEALAKHVEEVMKHMGIAGRAVEVTTPPSVYMYLPEDEPAPVQVQEKKGKKKDNRKSAFAFLTKRSPRISSPTPSSPAARAKSPLGNSLDLPTFNYDRRPSLPGHKVTTPPRTDAFKSPSLTNVLYPFRSTRSTASLMSEQDGDAAELLSNIMAFGEKSDVGLILNDYLLEKRFLLHVHTNGVGDWFLGNGKENATNVIDTMDAKLVGKKDVMSLAETFVHLRTAYGLPAISAEQMQKEQGLAKQWKKDQDKRASFNPSLHNVQALQDAIAAHEALTGRAGTPSTNSEKSKFKLVPVLEALYTDDSAAGSETSSVAEPEETETEVDGAETGTEVASDISEGEETEREGQDVLAMLEVPDHSPRHSRRSSVRDNRRMSTMSGFNTDYRNSVASTYAFSIREATMQLYSPSRAVAFHLRRYDSQASDTSGSAREDYMGGRIRSSSNSSASTLDARPNTATGHYFTHAHTTYPVPPPNKGRQRSLRGRASHTSVRSRSTMRTSRSDPSRSEQPDSPLPESHPGHPASRPLSTDSQHSLFSALNIETRLTGDALAQLEQQAEAETARRGSGPLFPGESTVSPTFTSPPLSANISPRQARRRSRTLSADMRADQGSLGSGSEGDAEDDYTPRRLPAPLPLTDMYRQASNISLTPGAGASSSASSSSSRTTPHMRPAPLASETDKTGLNRTKNGLPLAGILSLFTDVLMRRALGGDEGGESRNLERQVEKAVRDFVDGEKRFAQQNGGWDAEDMRRVVWLLRQVAALYPINLEIFRLTQNSAASSNSPQSSISKVSSRSTFSMSTPSLLLPEQNPGVGLGLGSMGRLKQSYPTASASAIDLGMPLSSGSGTRLSPIPSVPSSRSQSSLSLYSTETHEQAEMDSMTRPTVTISISKGDSDESPALTHVQTPRTADSFTTIRQQQREAYAQPGPSLPSLAIDTNADAPLDRTVSLDSDGEQENATDKAHARRKHSVGSEYETSDTESLSPAKKDSPSPVKFDAPWGRSAPSSPHLSPGASPRASPRFGQPGLFEEKMKKAEWGASYAASPVDGDYPSTSAGAGAASSAGVKRHDSFASVRTFGRPGEVVPGSSGSKRFSADSVFSDSKHGSSERAESPVKRGSRDGELAAMWDLRQALEASAKAADDATAAGAAANAGAGVAGGKVPRVSFLAPDAGAYARAQLDAESKGLRTLGQEAGQGQKGLVGADKRSRRMSGWL